jgi:hypothetical protein
MTRSVFELIVMESMWPKTNSVVYGNELGSNEDSLAVDLTLCLTECIDDDEEHLAEHFTALISGKIFTTDPKC